MDEYALPDSFDPESDVCSCGATHRGRVRENNQDQFLIAQLNKSMRISATSMPLGDRLYGGVRGEVLLVADGMGGHAAGEKASHLAIEHFVRRLLSSIHWHFHGEKEREAEFIEDLKRLLQDAHTRILLESAQHPDQRGMGTTLTMAYIVWPRMYVVHAGDSRCYLVRDGNAQQITTDHTLAHQMVEAGGLKPEDEADSKWSNVLWNVLGGRSDGSDVMAEVRRVDLKSRDRIVLCSDGLHRYVDTNMLAAVITSCDEPSESCERLIQMANDAGGEDNVTVIVSQPKSDETTNTTWIDDFDNQAPTDEIVDSISVSRSDSLQDTKDPDDTASPSDGDFEHSEYDPLRDTSPE